MHLLTIMSVVSLISLAAFSAYAERTSDYVAPTYAVRFARSFLTLMLFALPILVVAIVVARRSLTALRRRVAFAITISVAIVLLGSAVAATDALNDERWNPVFYGGFFVAATLPASVAMAAAKDDSRRTSMIVLAMILAFPLALAISGFGSTIVFWAFEHGIPATW